MSGDISGEAMVTGMLIWQIFYLLVLGGVGFLVIRLLIIKNFPRKPSHPVIAPSLDFYSVIIQWSANERVFVAEVPDLPGCIASGPNKTAALAASELAIGQWLQAAHAQNRPVPTPRPQLHFAPAN